MDEDRGLRVLELGGGAIGNEMVGMGVIVGVIFEI